MNQLLGPLRFIASFLGLLLLPAQLFGFGGPVPPAPGAGQRNTLPPYQNLGTNKRILVIPVQFSGGAANPLSQAAAVTALDEMDTWLRGASFGSFGFSQKTSTTVIPLSNTKAYYTGAGFSTLLNDARAAALAANASWNPANFEFDVVISESGTLANDGIAFTGSDGTWLPNSVSEPFPKSSFIHEFGHNLGLNHAGGWLRPSGSTNPLDPAGTVNVYGSLYDPLAYAGYPCHYSAHYKNLIGWLPAANVAVIDSTTVSNVRIYAHDGGSLNPARKYAIRIPTSVSDATTPGGRDYWLETRTIFNPGVPANKRDGLIVKWGDQIGSPRGSCDLDLTPNSLTPNNTINDFADAILTVGTLFADPWNAAPGSNRITVTPVASGGTGADKYVDVAITTPNADLSALTFSVGALSPGLTTATTGYTISAIGAASTTVTPTAAAGATIQMRFNGGTYTTIASGATSSALPLVSGPNTVDVKVTNGGWTKTYTVSIPTLTTFSALAGSLGNIPDGTGEASPVEGPARDVQFTVSGMTGTLSNVMVDFTLNPAHSYASDLVAKLIAPDGSTTHTVVSFTNLPSYRLLAGPYAFADDAGATSLLSTTLTALPAGGTAPTGRYRTQTNSGAATALLGTFSSLSGAALNGTWTLRFTDKFLGDTGTVSAANLYLAAASTAVIPTVTTAAQTSVTATTATLGGNVTADGGASVSERGIVWATTATPTIANNKVANGTGTGTFSGTVSSLPAATLIYVRAYATNTAGTGYGSQISFTTLSNPSFPEIALEQPAGTNLNSGVTVAYGTQTVGVAGAAKTFTIKNTGAGPLTVSSASVTGGNAGDFIVNTTGMASSVPATTGSTTFTVTFNPSAVGARSTTLRIVNNDSDEGTFDLLLTGTGISLPTVTTADPTSVAATSASLGGNVTSAGGGTVSDRGIVWNTTGIPTIASNKVANGSGTGSFTATVSSLPSGTLIYVRAYATNGVGTAYGSEKDFTTTFVAGPGTIVWGAAQNWNGAATQVLANGVRHSAVCFVPTTAANPVVNGVTFDRPAAASPAISSTTATTINFVNSSNISVSSWWYNTTSAPVSGSGDFVSIVNQASFNQLQPGTITLGSLVVGQDYQVQIFMPYWEPQWPTMFSSVSGAIVTLSGGRASGSPAAQYVTGTFTAAATSHVINFSAAAPGPWAGVSAISVRRTSLSSNADLSALTTTAGSLTFAAATTSYSASVPNATTSVTVTPTVAQANATVKVNAVTVSSGAASGPVSLNVGANTITTVVTAEDGTTTKTYTLTVTRAAPALTGVAISPTAVITTSQWLASGDGTKDNMINASGLSGAGPVLTQLHDNSGSGASMWHAGPTTGGISGGTTGNPPAVNSQAIEFDLGANYDLTGAHIWNMNQFGSIGRGVKDVQILISSATTGAFTPLITTIFTQGTGNAGLAAQVVPFTGATNVRRVRFAIQTAWSGLAEDYVGLSEVRFQGSAVVLSNNADLSALATTAGTLTPAFAAATTSYTASVPNATASVTVTPTVAQANATVKVNTVTVTSGTASGTISLNVGANTISTVVTAQDGTTTKTYTLTVTRAAASGGGEVVGTNLGPIPENTTGREISFDVTGRTGTVSAVAVQFTLNPPHTFLSDLTIQLIAPDNTNASIFQIGGGLGRGSNVAGPYLFSDTGTITISATANALGDSDATIPTGTYRAEAAGTAIALNTVFSGKAPNGTWKLRFIDNFASDTGTVSQASLTLTTGIPIIPIKATITRQAGGGMQVQLENGAASQSYVLRRSANLQTWSTLKVVTTDALGSATHLDAAPPAGKAFYQFKTAEFGAWTLFQNVANGEVAQRIQELQQTFPQKEWRWVPATSGRANIEFRDVT